MEPLMAEDLVLLARVKVAATSVVSPDDPVPDGALTTVREAADRPGPGRPPR